MLYNIQQLQTNLRLLISQFEEITKNHESKRYSNLVNKASVLSRVPKVLFLQKICIYLNDPDLIVISNLSKLFRKLIYSPIGWKILSYTRNPIRYKYKIQKYNEDDQNYHEFNEGNMIFDTNQIHLLKQKKNILKETLKIQFQKYQNAKQKYQMIVQRIRVEKKLQLKYRDKGKILEQEINLLENRNISYRQTMKHLNQQFESKMKIVSVQEQNLIQERNKLQNQKQALVCKIRQYQSDIQKIKKQSYKSKQMLKKVKSYLLYKQI